MALPIASIPILTGEVAEEFEAKAQDNYNKYLNRTDEEKKVVQDQFERGMSIVKKVLANSQLKK